MGRAEQSIKHVCSLTKLKHVRERGKHPVEFKSYYKTVLPVNLGTHCSKLPAGKANADEQINACGSHSKPHDIVIYMDGSVTRDRSV